MKKIILSAILITNTLLLTGCLLTSAISTTILVSNDRRSTGEVVDDNSIAFSLLAWGGENKALKNAHLNFMVYDKEVLVTGEAPTTAVYDYITVQTPLKDFKIKKVINEVRVASNTSLLSRGKDAIITGKIEALFLDQEVFNPVHIRVMTENRSVYLMGAVTMREANKATKIVAKVGGVERIVKLFHYLKNRPAAEIQREKEKKLQAEEEARIIKEREVLEAKKAELRRQIRALDPKGGTDFSPE
ncbi:MAG: BON domain-containing protein [Gammaproteobacteria bacterium]|nr:BON domain-containing protein [Gammaproteobacteria bacterium]